MCRPAVAKWNLQPVRKLPATNRLRLAICLPLRNTNELSSLLQEIYDPASPKFRHYPTLDQFTDRFGPAKDQYDAVKQFAQKYHLDVTGTFSNRAVLDVAGQVSDIEQAFRVNLNIYQHPTKKRTFYAPDVEPTIDAGLAVVEISGLNNYFLPRSALHPCSYDYASTEPGTGSGPNGSFMRKNFRNAYVPGVSLGGTGQSVGLLAFGAYYPGDFALYEK
jgi:subtilase family serine protease